MNQSKKKLLEDFLKTYQMPGMIEAKIVMRYADKYEEIPFRMTADNTLEELEHFITDDMTVLYSPGSYDPWTTGVERSRYRAANSSH
jgi:hypothetical protein